MGEVCEVSGGHHEQSVYLPHAKRRRAMLDIPLTWTLEERQLCDLEMLLSGAFEPLQGFLCQDDYLSVLNNMRLTNGKVWTIPIVLSIPKNATSPNTHWKEVEDADSNAGAMSDQEASSRKILKLRDGVGSVIAEVEVVDVYEPDIDMEMLKVLGTTDLHHPYAQFLHRHHRNCVYVGGPVRACAPIYHFDFVDYRLTAPECRRWISENGWDVVIGFQTRNPMHRSHFELTCQAVKEVTEAEGKPARLLLSPTGGPTQPGDVDNYIRMRCYKRILRYYGGMSVKLVTIPLAMRMAGPREAVWHATVRRNYGCTHFIVGRDHAGPSTRKEDGSPFYGPYEAHDLLKKFQSELGIKPVFGTSMMYVGDELGGYIPSSKVPPNVQAKEISGTRLREMLVKREAVPEWFTFPEVAEELQKFHLPRHQCGLCVYFTGLPCSGKSTLANAMEAALRESQEETRRVTLLDADVVRLHLSTGLGFSREDRSSNVRRIGFVASEVVKHGGICLVANIAPYEADRQFNRELITSTGGAYVEVYVSTPIDVCERRDVKELYKKARQGVIKQFTGVSDPYQAPTKAELVIDSSSDVKGKVQMVLDCLRQEGWIR